MHRGNVHTYFQLKLLFLNTIGCKTKEKILEEQVLLKEGKVATF